AAPSREQRAVEARGADADDCHRCADGTAGVADPDAIAGGAPARGGGASEDPRRVGEAALRTKKTAGRWQLHGGMKMAKRMTGGRAKSSLAQGRRWVWLAGAAGACGLVFCCIVGVALSVLWRGWAARQQTENPDDIRAVAPPVNEFPPVPWKLKAGPGPKL